MATSVESTKGTCQPPRKSVVARQATMIVSRKSVRKNIPNFMPLYSTKYPMISDSASGRSKGARLVSASAAVTKTMKATGCTTMPQFQKYSVCRSTSSARLIVP